MEGPIRSKALWEEESGHIWGLLNQEQGTVGRGRGLTQDTQPWAMLGRGQSLPQGSQPQGML